MGKDEMGHELVGSEAASRQCALSISRSEATAIARRIADGWFIAECGDRFVIGRFTSKGHRQLITYREEPLAFDDVCLADDYLRKIGVEWPLHLAY